MLIEVTSKLIVIVVIVSVIMELNVLIFVHTICARFSH